MLKTIIFGLVGIVIGIVFLRVHGAEQRDLRELTTYGKSAVVAPPAKYTAYTRKGVTTYTAEFRFKTEAGQEMNVRHSFPEAVLNKFKAGQPVSIYYMPKEPSRVGFAETTQESSILPWAGWGFVIASLGYLALGLLGRRQGS